MGIVLTVFSKIAFKEFFFLRYQIQTTQL
ncbi:hypothetical protein CIY_34280 [Butyrivibrio fibrisolvens 16/4]|nr:hypothetical protein CIY_34280 [Butyrivibrio fibrisolvens 16/4]